MGWWPYPGLKFHLEYSCLICFFQLTASFFVSTAAWILCPIICLMLSHLFFSPPCSPSPCPIAGCFCHSLHPSQVLTHSSFLNSPEWNTVSQVWVPKDNMSGSENVPLTEVEFRFTFWYPRARSFVTLLSLWGSSNQYTTLPSWLMSQSIHMLLLQWPFPACP